MSDTYKAMPGIFSHIAASIVKLLVINVVVFIIHRWMSCRTLEGKIVLTSNDLFHQQTAQDCNGDRSDV
jgi:hypothetical protein